MAKALKLKWFVYSERRSDMKKVYARQINPEYQQSDLEFWGEEALPEGVIIKGNPRMRSMNTWMAEDLIEKFDYLVDEVEWSKDHEEEYSLMNIVADFFGDHHGTEEQWDRLILDSSGQPDYYPLIDLLELTTGLKYDSRMIKGCSQSDWNIIYFPACKEASVERIEREYFNTGTEWVVHEGDEEIEDPNHIRGCAVYCYSWSTEGIKKEIADHEGVRPDDVVLFKYTGTKPKYERV